MSTATNRREVDNLAAQTPTWRRLSSVLVRTLAPFGDAARAVSSALRKDRSAPFTALAREIDDAIRAPAAPAAIDLAKASTFEERSLVCAELMLTGQWKTSTVPELARAWGVDPAAISNYRRAGQVARAAMTLDLAEKLDDTLAHLLRMQEANERQADALEARGAYTEAARYRATALQARRHYAEVAGLVQHKVSLSLEADPRVAGMYQAILAALEDRDRQEAEREQRLGAWLVAVEKLTGGVLPEGRPEALPSVREHVRDAVKRYEVDLGARTEARRIAA